MKTASIIASLTLLLTASGITGYKIVKTKNYGGTEENLHKVISVIDGDTFYIKGDSEEEKERVRILSISAPEKGECYFKESTQALKDLIEEKEVKLIKDVSGADDYKRFLRHVILPSGGEKEDNILISQYMIENGFAKNIIISPDLLYKEMLDKAEYKAIKTQAGVWGNCKTLPKNFDDETITNAKPTNKDCIIKGNIADNGRGEKTYFLPTCSPYSLTKINIEKGEKYFCTEAEAKKAGFTLSASCPNK
ncbi:thermonuclease family protein [Patescibacteria group bacterium]